MLRKGENTSFRKLRYLFIFSLFVLIPVLMPFSAHAAGKQPTLNHTVLSIKEGYYAQLRVKNYKESVKWKTSNSYVAIVSKKGYVKGVHTGNAVISVKAGKKTLKCRVTVIEDESKKPRITSYKLDEEKVIPTAGTNYVLYIMNNHSTSWSWSINTPDTAEFTRYNEGQARQTVHTFYGRPGKVVVTARSGETVLSYEFELHMDPEQESLVRLRKEVLSQLIYPGMPPQEQCLVIAKWISDNASYVKTDGPDYSLLTDHIGQCMHYAYAYDFLMDGTSIPCIYVQDNDHAWNQVLIDGEWYNVDVTSMDTARGSHDYAYHNFMVSDAAFWRKGPRKLPYHECTSTRYDFLWLDPFQRAYEGPWADGTWRNY